MKHKHIRLFSAESDLDRVFQRAGGAFVRAFFGGDNFYWTAGSSVFRASRRNGETRHGFLGRKGAKDRRKIEMFFKKPKQNLRIKTFVGNSEMWS
jgi:hypothetical protein